MTRPCLLQSMQFCPFGFEPKQDVAGTMYREEASYPRTSTTHVGGKKKKKMSKAYADRRGKNKGKPKPADLHPFKSQTPSCATYIQFPHNSNINGGSLINVSAKGTLVASASHRFLPSPVKAVCIPVKCSLHSLALALASHQGHTTLLWLIKVPNPIFLRPMVC